MKQVFFLTLFNPPFSSLKARVTILLFHLIFMSTSSKNKPQVENFLIRLFTKSSMTTSKVFCAFILSVDKHNPLFFFSSDPILMPEFRYSQIPMPQLFFLEHYQQHYRYYKPFLFLNYSKACEVLASDVRRGLSHKIIWKGAVRSSRQVIGRTICLHHRLTSTNQIDRRIAPPPSRAS